jgi:hypothetical protein
MQSKLINLAVPPDLEILNRTINIHGISFEEEYLAKLVAEHLYKKQI